ncbi:hypothetical protein E4U43_002044 [Claviceps pusilla]|uniref:SPX domain-containing protein n=1 Tax=Claviceps pusilla TaxID=123648 RepID=A0A9P7SWE4_9HYPO|nr:hypothetical protein E4U43_002044 [Claviceps pusilla]
MKYGEQLERASIPEWSLHNLDYNSLKHEIKVHTMRDQATAMAIPGHTDTALQKFEDSLYLELCRQHDRVGMFITSKADEISRRLEHLASQIQRWVAKYADADDRTLSFKRQRRFAKYERELLRCGEETLALSRFANAQITAFRKILKKYKVWNSVRLKPRTLRWRGHGGRGGDDEKEEKGVATSAAAAIFNASTSLYIAWRCTRLTSIQLTQSSLPQKWTGSVTLSYRFNEDILGNPKSFTKRTFEHLRNRYDEILTDLQATTPELSEPSSPDPDEQAGADGLERGRFRQVHHQLPLTSHTSSPVKYWNEYDHGSDAGGPEDDYAIYINPDDKTGFPGFAFVNSMLAVPYEKAKKWLKMRQPSDEHRPLLNSSHDGSHGYESTALESEEEGFSSSDGYPQVGYATHYALPSIGEQKVQRYREKVLMWTTLACFLFSFALLAIDSVLILTGKHKLRVEVDAGVTVGTMISLFCAGSGLGMTLYRRDALSLPYKVMVWSAFIASCILNGMLLVLVLGNVP